jgi:hypothetical protein
MELADAAEGEAGWRAALARAEPGFTLGDRIDCSRSWAGACKLERDRVELDTRVAEERRDLRHADLERVARQVVAARGELMVPAAIEVVGRVGIAEQAGEPASFKVWLAMSSR